MLLAVDIGNTNITLGLFQGANLLISWRLSTLPDFTPDEYGTKILDLFHYSLIERNKIKPVFCNRRVGRDERGRGFFDEESESVALATVELFEDEKVRHRTSNPTSYCKIRVKALAVASVVPKLTPVFEELASHYFKIKAFIVDENAKIPIKNLYENPKEVGADRLVNAVAARAKFEGPSIVIDFGTATTFDCISKKGEYLGGLIFPGPMLAAESLALRTAKLPKVAVSQPKRTIGRNTVESIQAGLYFGYISLIDGITERLKKELGGHARLIVTGGLAPLMVGDSKFIKKEHLFPDLTLEGIRLVWEKNNHGD